MFVLVEISSENGEYLVCLRSISPKRPFGTPFEGPRGRTRSRGSNFHRHQDIHALQALLSFRAEKGSAVFVFQLKPDFFRLHDL